MRVVVGLSVGLCLCGDVQARAINLPSLFTAARVERQAAADPRPPTQSQDGKTSAVHLTPRSDSLIPALTFFAKDYDGE